MTLSRLQSKWGEPRPEAAFDAGACALRAQVSLWPVLLPPVGNCQYSPSYRRSILIWHLGVRLEKRNAWAGREWPACCLLSLGLGAMLRRSSVSVVVVWSCILHLRAGGLYPPPPLSPSEDHQATPSYRFRGVAVG